MALPRQAAVYEYGSQAPSGIFWWRRGPPTPPASCQFFVASLLSSRAFFPRRRTPLTQRGEGRRRGKNAPWLRQHAAAWACGCLPSAAVGWRALRSGRQARTTVYPCEASRPHAPCTVYAQGVRHATSKSPPIERTVPSQTPGGRTAALTDLALIHCGGYRLTSHYLLSVGFIGHAPRSHASAAATLACRRAVESTRNRQSFSRAPSGHSPRSR